MKRRIFVGSSTEGLGRAQHICNLLSTVADTEGVLWKTVFQPGFVTLEALEAMLGECSGAVFVATPDDTMSVRGKTISVPRSNVMLEFGLVAGRMCRHSVALCRYGGAVLPSDLEGLTDIAMDPCSVSDDQADAEEFRQDAEEKLRHWCKHLLATIETVPRTDIVHGYTGKWDFNLQLRKWRCLEISPPSFVQVHGSFDLFVAVGGQAGRGCLHGHVFAKFIKDGKAAYEADYRSAQKITNALCGADGSLELRTEAFVLQPVNSMGKAPSELTGLDIAPDPWSARWQLSPCSDPRSLHGTVHSDCIGMLEGTVDAIKSADVA